MGRGKLEPVHRHLLRVEDVLGRPERGLHVRRAARRQARAHQESHGRRVRGCHRGQPRLFVGRCPIRGIRQLRQRGGGQCRRRLRGFNRQRKRGDRRCRGQRGARRHLHDCRRRHVRDGRRARRGKHLLRDRDLAVIRLRALAGRGRVHGQGDLCRKRVRVDRRDSATRRNPPPEDLCQPLDHEREPLL